MNKKPKPKRCWRCRYDAEMRPCTVCYPEKAMKAIEEKLGHELGQSVSYEISEEERKKL